MAAAPAITVTHTAGADALDIFSEYLTTKTCFAFVLDTTLYDHRAATAAATTAVLRSISAAHDTPLAALEDTYADLSASHTPSPTDTWPAYQKQLFRELLSSANAPADDATLDDLFRTYKKTVYAQLHPAAGALPLLRSLLKRSAHIVVAVDAAAVPHVPRDMAAWLVEHLYLDNFVDRIAALDAGSDAFADALRRLDVRPDETVLFAGAQRDARAVAAREGVEAVVVAADAVAEGEREGRGRGGSSEGMKVETAEDGVWEIGGLMVARNAVRMTLHERDRSVDTPRM
ncbi:hypothetical protein GTA08_BOTSDO05056 [Neofusicoccum parvum]|uniref:Uncharacterized protein n=1 Tax=Neofusicoccum parvum TaxID=310453 RepID=A0ACB5RWK1_9PEZI|nr:hypothetical protein GTA08_BOTSDO05056 [Neofusicoccum parvum]